MSAITIALGLLWAAAGLLAQLAGARPGWSAALIGFGGLTLLALGLLARRESLRMHAMHAAVLIGVVLFIVFSLRSFDQLRGLASGTNGWDAPTALLNCGAALTSVVFITLCVRSFVAARRERDA